MHRAGRGHGDGHGDGHGGHEHGHTWAHVGMGMGMRLLIGWACMQVHSPGLSSACARWGRRSASVLRQ